MKLVHSTTYASWLLRIGLALALVYAAISSLLTPNDWIGYLPHFLTTWLPALLVLRLFSVYELALAGWLLSGYYVRYSAALAAATFSGILLSNLGLLAITFRDIPMIFASLALLFLED